MKKISELDLYLFEIDGNTLLCNRNINIGDRGYFVSLDFDDPYIVDLGMLHNEPVNIADIDHLSYKVIASTKQIEGTPLLVVEDLIDNLHQKELYIEVEEKHFRTVKNNEDIVIDHQFTIEPKIENHQIIGIWKKKNIINSKRNF